MSPQIAVEGAYIGSSSSKLLMFVTRLSCGLLASQVVADRGEKFSQNGGK